MCVPVPDVNTPGGTGGESTGGGVSTDTSSSSSEPHEAWESPSAPADVETPAVAGDDSPAPTGPKINTDEPSVAGTNSRAALEAMQDKEEYAKPSGKPGLSNGGGKVNTPVGAGSSTMALGHNSSSALTHTLTSKKPAPITEPLPAVTETTPQEFVGTVVDTAHGVAVQVGEELSPVDDSVADSFKADDTADLSYQKLWGESWMQNTSNRGSITKPGDYLYDPKATKYVPNDDQSEEAYKARHDFCTYSPDQFPAPGQNADFSGACARHDMCYDRVDANGDGYLGCNNQLREDMKTVCRENYTSLADPRRSACLDTAEDYWTSTTASHRTNLNYAIPLEEVYLPPRGQESSS